MSEVDDDDLDGLRGCWYTLFALRNRDTCRTVQEIDLMILEQVKTSIAASEALVSVLPN